MKKIYKFILIVTATLSFGACDDFLTVRPKSSVPDYLMFTSEKGFNDALHGSYLVLRQYIFNVSGPYYGGSAYKSTGYLEYLGGVWRHSGSEQSFDAQMYGHNYQYGQIVSTTNDYFKNMYRTVTNLNLLLDWIDNSTQNFLSEKAYSNIKGEALALRSFLLFDLIRAFGPPPAETGYHQTPYIPYPKELNVGYYKKEKYADYMKMLTSDILEAERLLEKHDPILSESPDETRRRNKMNYYALMGLKARVMLWQGNKTEALAAALTVINAKNPNGSEKFPFKAPTAYSSTSDVIGFSEQMFAFENDIPIKPYNITDNAACFKIYTAEATEEGGDRIVTFTMTKDTEHLQRLFPDAVFTEADSTLRSQDLRFAKQMAFNKIKDQLYCIKYYPLTMNGHTTALPVLRKGEMLLIAAECAPTLQEAENYLNTLRAARWLYKENDANWGKPYTPVVLIDTDKDLARWIKGEYAREFIMEGQSFFAWKRMRRMGDADDKIPFPSMEFYGDAVVYGGDVYMTPEKYIIPVPAAEISSNE